jgi:hypothetical protein
LNETKGDATQFLKWKFNNLKVVGFFSLLGRYEADIFRNFPGSERHFKIVSEQDENY